MSGHEDGHALCQKRVTPAEQAIQVSGAPPPEQLHANVERRSDSSDGSQGQGLAMSPLDERDG
jgi:hypothetical protein